MAKVNLNSPRYKLSQVAEFYEVFDCDNMETVFVSEKRPKAEYALAQMTKTGKIDKKLREAD